MLIAAGVLCLVFCNNEDFQNACILAVGIIVVLDALLRLVLDVVSVVSSGDATLIKTSYGQAITGSLELATGAILIMVGANKTDAGIIFEYLGWFIGILMIVLGIILCVYAGLRPLAAPANSGSSKARYPRSRSMQSSIKTAPAKRRIEYV